MYFIVVVVIWIEMNTAWRTYMCGHACAHESTPKSKSTRKYFIEYLSILIRKTSQNSLIHITYTSISIGISFNLLRFFFHRYSSQLSPLNFHCMAAFAVSSYLYIYLFWCLRLKGAVQQQQRRNCVANTRDTFNEHIEWKSSWEDEKNQQTTERKRRLSSRDIFYRLAKENMMSVNKHIKCTLSEWIANNLYNLDANVSAHSLYSYDFNRLDRHTHTRTQLMHTHPGRENVRWRECERER